MLDRYSLDCEKNKTGFSNKTFLNIYIIVSSEFNKNILCISKSYDLFKK